MIRHIYHSPNWIWSVECQRSVLYYMTKTKIFPPQSGRESSHFLAERKTRIEPKAGNWWTMEQSQVKTTSANMFWSQTTSVNSTLNTATALCSGLCDVWRSINSGWHTIAVASCVSVSHHDCWNKPNTVTTLINPSVDRSPHTQCKYLKRPSWDSHHAVGPYGRSYQQSIC